MKRFALPARARGDATVTVVIPCYRYGRYLPAATASILSQPGVDARVLIVDDASPDDSADIARELASRDPRVRVIVHDENRGHIRTYNDGLAQVDTEFVSLVSADDVVAPGALGRAVALMQRHPRVGLVYGAIRTFSGQERALPTRRSRHHLWRIWGSDEWIEMVARTGYNPIASPEAVLRTAALREAGGYNPRLPHSGDLEYWLRVAARWEVGQIRGPIQAYYRVHGANMHTTDFGTQEADLRERLAAFEVLADPAITAALPAAPHRLHLAAQTIGRQLDALSATNPSTDTTALDELRQRVASAGTPAARSRAPFAEETP